VGEILCDEIAARLGGTVSALATME